MVPDNRTDGPDRPTPSPGGFREHVSRTVDRFGELAPFALFPLLTALLDVQSVRAALNPDPTRRSYDVGFNFPSPSTDLWYLTDPPESTAVPPDTVQTGGIDVFVDGPIPITIVGQADAGGVDLVVSLLVLVVGYVLLAAAITAVYVGGLDRRLRGARVAPRELVVRYAPRYLAYFLVVFGAVLAIVPVVLVAPGFVLLAMPLVLVFAYLFYATPFLFVVEDAGVIEGFRRSYRYALEGGQYLWFALWHLAVSAVASIVLSVLVNGGPAGFLLALAVATPLSLVLTAATVSFLQERSPKSPREGGATGSQRPGRAP